MKLSFQGAAEGVTGSCHMVETSKGKLLIDCGMFQGERICSKHNLEPFSFDPKEISAVIVTHAHVDHTGRLPLLIARGFTGKIFFTPPTLALSKLILADTQHIMADNAKRCGDPQLYSIEDMEGVGRHAETRNYHEAFEPIPGVTAMFHDAGHILGSSYITVEIPAEETKTGEKMRFVFSGDVGNDDVPILPDTEQLSHADVAIVESTYGDRDHGPTAERTQKLLDTVKKVIDRGGTLLIPAFSIERTQELMYEIDGLIDAGKLPRFPIYLDSPLAIRATELYRHFKEYLTFDRPILSSKDLDFFAFPGLHETLDKDASRAINNDHHAKIIIAGSGMMTGGRILHHLMRYLGDPKNCVLIVGYQANGTLGAAIAQHAKQVNIFSEMIPVRAEVSYIHEFSAHGDRSKVARWLTTEEGSVKKVFLVHGDTDAKISFKAFLEQKIPGEIFIPKLYEVFEF